MPRLVPVRYPAHLRHLRFKIFLHCCDGPATINLRVIVDPDGEVKKIEPQMTLLPGPWR
jgi:hypothetical protein